MTAGKLNLASNNQGVSIDIINLGIEEEQPKFSFFNTVYRRHTNFSMDNKELEISGTPGFGNTINIKFQQNGDLVGDVYFEITLPAPTSCFTNGNMPNSYANWTNTIGYALIDSVKLKIGGNAVDEQSGLWLDIQNELTDPSRKMWSMIGKVDDQTKLKFFQNRSTKYTVPLQFSFCKIAGLAIPIFLTGAESNKFEIEVQFRSLANLLLHDGGTVKGNGDVNIEFKAHAKYYALESEEITKIKDYRKFDRNGRKKIDNSGELVHLIETVNVIPHQTSTDFTIEGIKGSIKEFIWVLQHDDKNSSNNAIIRDNTPISSHTGNDHFNYAGTSVTNDSADPFTSLTVHVGPRFEYENKNASHFRQYLPYKHHSNVPNNYVYTLPLCLHPEDYQPSGTFNLLNTNTNIRFQFFGVHSGYKIKLFAVTYRFLLMNTNTVNIDNVTSKVRSKFFQDKLKAEIDFGFESKTTFKPQPRPIVQSDTRRAQAIVSSGDMTLINNQIQTQGIIINELQSRLDQSNKAILGLKESIVNLTDKIERDGRTVRSGPSRARAKVGYISPLTGTVIDGATS